MEAFEFSKTRATHNYTLRDAATPYYVMWLLHGELHVKLEQGKIEEARAAVKAFAELLRAKLANGDRTSEMLFTAVRLTQASRAGEHDPRDFVTGKLIETPRLTPSDLQPVWELISSVPPSEWDTRHIGQRNLPEMIERATGRTR
ncbi:MAG: hypothetical protein PHD04_02375 [Candidatus Pacebacteria bacterium]|nr:hypothetical protein [Candidatus Paceibacterota bacterium]